MDIRAVALSTLLALAALSGCTSSAPDESVDDNQTTPTPTANVPTSGAHFEIADMRVARTDGTPGELHEDDAGARVIYTIRQPASAPAAETAFVTYLFNGKIVDVVQLKLAPGEEKRYDRAVNDLHNRTFTAEVRAGASVQKVTGEVLLWPRAGQDTLAFGPLQVRADYGLMAQDNHVLVNLTLTRNETMENETTFKDLRARLLCIASNGTIRSTPSVRFDPPEPGNSTGVDVVLNDCGSDPQYGLEFRAYYGGELQARMLLVPVRRP